MIQLPALHERREWSGFTLIELMIAVAILAILTAVALPAYQSSVQKGRRADAMAAIASIQQAQERWRGNNPAYSTELGAAALNIQAPPQYSLAIVAPAASASLLSRGYVVTATGLGSQAGDSQCARMSVRVFEGNLKYAGCGSCSSFSETDYAPTHPCFSR